ncbi:N-formylglutamate amidohydrolase [Acidisoma cellulosilytica]|uniref:N-formylglutamate amidohydrolase n=1 Tax=Acidisoma cellulosilyticum TaxID=2802395 RepID=A0A964E4T5_9PROT|nr:N-formylglutamate amidohydrolase [Acidisoma cellulosilyticum]MCB8881821.1 N-formylglutamate amidohydrolase [Acidisoma cellulosilyticum]
MNDATILLSDDEPAPVVIDHAQGTSDLFLTCDHAGRRIPLKLGQLGVSDAEMQRHIAYDIGARAVALRLADALDATLIRQVYSRLVIDCNRDPSVPSSIPEISETTEIPGNIGLTDDQRLARQVEIFQPYHDAITAALDARLSSGQRTAIIAVHSFTPVYKGEVRPWHAGLLYNRDARMSLILKRMLEEEGGLVIGDNEPYFVSDLTDYTIPVHAERRRLPYLELEIRQDLIATEAGQAEWAERLIRLLPRVWAEFQASV